VLGSLDGYLAPAAWLTGISPLSMPFYASGTLLSLADLPLDVARAIPRAFYFWLLVGVVATVWLLLQLWAARTRMAASVLAAPETGPPALPA
jgi:hypothetical protein